GIVFAIFLALQFKGRPPAAPATAVERRDPNAVAETKTGVVLRINRNREEVTIRYDSLVTYGDGSNKFFAVKVTVPDREHPDRQFLVTAKEGLMGKDESQIDLDGDVQMQASDGMQLRTEHATFTQADGNVQAPGPVTFS